MARLVAYTLMIPDPISGELTERVHVVNPWIKTSLPGVFPETFDLWPKGRGKDESEDDFLARVAGRRVPAGQPWHLVDSEDLLPLRRWRYRDRVSHDPEDPTQEKTTHVWECCWRIRDGKVVVDLPTAQRRRGYELRLMRDSKAQALASKKVMADALSQPTQAKAHGDRLKVLVGLDLDSQIAAITDLETLATWVPSELQGE